MDGYVHVSRFLDMHDIGDALVRARFADPVMDVERMTLTYGSPMALMREIKAIGAGNASPERARGLTGRDRIARLCEAYERFRDADGRLPVSYEVIHGHAWMPMQRRVGGDSHAAGDPVGREETDPPDIPFQPVGGFPHGGPRLVVHSRRPDVGPAGDDRCAGDVPLAELGDAGGKRVQYADDASR